MKRTTRARLRQLARSAPTPAHLREIATLALTEADRTQRIFEAVFGGSHTVAVLLSDSRIPEEQRAVGLRRVAARIIGCGYWKPYTPALRRAFSERAEKMATTVERAQRDILALGLNEALRSRQAARAAALPSPLYASWLIEAAKYRAESLLLEGKRRGRHAATQRVKSAGRRVSLDALLAGRGAPELRAEPLEELRREAADRRATRHAEDQLAKLTPAQRAYLQHLLDHPGLPDVERDRQLGKRAGYTKAKRADILRRVVGG